MIFAESLTVEKGLQSLSVAGAIALEIQKGVEKTIMIKEIDRKVRPLAA